ncbi:stemmadenine O-acetyltransferase [Ricinus communis]|uniref:Anthranilate N-benzoyltransferase protein, putative n=1 Tax=Ricinus communis TaxID=3988 RepID=B9RAL9_RICCO|nr:stemmadenine O-acetyltransferase [Ricinus communis]EEF51846.1 Anthranilate N-benzoyltransferase protein, putative [Ricinus communis]|eukprot:XP_025013827.1 vinorine synthase-like [Ricinus communis]
MNSVNVLVTSRETIKPSSPTPQTLKCFKLSLLDQLSPAAYVPMIIYYASNSELDEVKNQERLDLLKKSLSRTLTQFYPLAGRVKENLFIECNDQGVDFFEARVNCPLSEILRRPEADVLNQFLPHEYHVPAASSMEFQVAIQVNTFTCGGIAIGTSISHKLVDGITFTCFMNNWASIARGSDEHSPPVFVGPHFFPPKDLSGLFPVLDIPQAKNITKRFLFDLSKVASLRERVFGGSGSNAPSRVEIVSALIWKYAMDASSRAKPSSGCNKSPSFLTQTVNLRARMNPPLPDSAAGNFIWLIIAPAPSDFKKIELHELVYQVQNSFKNFNSEFVKKIQGEAGLLVLGETLDQIGELVSRNVDIYRFTSLRKFQLYEADFGWGVPAWVSSAGLAFKNVVVLIETRDADRIEAWITLEEEVMAIFEHNQELLSFDSTTQSSFLNSNL